MLHLSHYTTLPLHSPSSSFVKNQIKSISLSGSRVKGHNELWGFKKSARNGLLNAVEKDSDFEVDPDKAREALRKLDEQLQSLSKKQVNPPKIRAVDLKQSSPRKEEETSEISGSFLAYVASALLLFTILYNVLFLTVIKPSIDEGEFVLSGTMNKDSQEVALSRREELPTGP